MTTKSSKLHHILHRSYLTTSLIPLVVIELVLLVTYFGINHYISYTTRQALLTEVTDSLREITGREASNIDNQLKDVSRHAILMQRDHEAFFRNPDFCYMPNGEPTFLRHANGALYKKENFGGSSLYYSSDSKIGPAEMRKARCSEALDPLLESIVQSTPIITQAYLNTWDNMNRLYPFMPDAPGQYGPVLRMQEYNFYYEADAAHNPARKPVWTGVYLDPAGQGWMVSVIVPIYNGDFLEGVSGLDVTIDTFIHHILDLRMSWEGKPFLIDGSGMILAMPESVQDLFNLRELTSHEYNASIRTTVEKPDEYNIFTMRDQTIRSQLQRMFDSRARITDMSFGGVNYLVSQEIVPETGWRLITLVDKAVIFANVNALKKLGDTIGYIAIALMAIFYVAFFLFLRRKSTRIAARIAEPIERLTELTATLLEKQQPLTFEEAGIREIDTLGKHFCEMSAELDKRNKDLIEAHIREKHKESEAERLERLVITDRLTGIFNRHKLDTVLLSELERSRRSDRSFSVMMMDIDHFKEVNDSFGHQVGDMMLRELAQLLLRTIRNTDTVGRWGGEEFLIVCPDTDGSGAYSLAEKLRGTIAAHAFPVAISLTASFGIAVSLPEDRITDLIARADKALYLAKHQGRNRVELFSAVLH